MPSSLSYVIITVNSGKLQTRKVEKRDLNCQYFYSSGINSLWLQNMTTFGEILITQEFFFTYRTNRNSVRFLFPLLLNLATHFCNISKVSVCFLLSWGPFNFIICHFVGSYIKEDEQKVKIHFSWPIYCTAPLKFTVHLPFSQNCNLKLLFSNTNPRNNT